MNSREQGHSWENCMLSWSRNPDFVELECSLHVHKASKYTSPWTSWNHPNFW